MKGHIQTLIILLFFIASPVHADIIVLVHGYHSSGNTWRYNGISQLLATNGWRDAGIYTPNGNFTLFGHFLANTGKHLVTAELPSEAPVEIQANLLGSYLKDINQKFPQQKIHLVAHSSAGIISRFVLVNYYAQNELLNVSQLITIASPHLGSPIAKMAETASDTPIGFIAPVFGGNDINRAEVLFKQLSPEDKNQFLFWLNRQPHPPINYTSIIRANGSIMKGDWVVPPNSQNMFFVPAIGKSSYLIMTPGDHNLKYADGFLLLELLP